MKSKSIFLGGFHSKIKTLMEPIVSNGSVLFFFLFLSLSPPVRSTDAEVLLSLKSSFDPLNLLPWQGTNACSWQGVRECLNGRVTKLVLEYFNLSGMIQEQDLNQLDQLRVLSLKSNSLSGEIPQLSGLINLKTLYLNNNNFSGEIPGSISGLHRLKVVVLAGNRISGLIPSSLLNLHRLYMLYLQDNHFTGTIPPFNQSSLKFFNVSNNQLSGKIPPTPSLLRFNKSSFSGNLELCGVQFRNPCRIPFNLGPSMSPAYPTISISRSSASSKKLIKIIAGSVGGFILLLIFMFLLFLTCKNGREEDMSKAAAGGSGMECNNGEKEGSFSWEGDAVGTLVFLEAGDCSKMNYSLADLLKASAETLGRGSLGSTYKAVMESGYIVTVKRLKDAGYPRVEEFRRHVALIGRLRHPKLVPLRAYFQAKEERLLVYDYFPNGSIFSLIHGTRTSDGGKPLHWTSCLKVAQDVATGLLYIHQNPGLTHGNLKSTNILLGTEFESCLTDYGLTSFCDPNSLELEQCASSFFYRAPECRNPRRPSTQPGDVYSFGVLLLELLTGRTPYQDHVEERHLDIPRWVRSIREEEMVSSDEPNISSEMAQEKLQALLDIAMACLTYVPEKRPHMRDVLKMIRDARMEVQFSSSNGSDNSIGRWSDTVQSWPKDHVSYV